MYIKDSELKEVTALIKSLPKNEQRLLRELLRRYDYESCETDIPSSLVQQTKNFVDGLIKAKIIKHLRDNVYAINPNLYTHPSEDMRQVMIDKWEENNDNGN